MVASRNWQYKDDYRGTKEIPLRTRIIIARKRSLRMLCFYTCLSFCQQGGGYPSINCRWYPSMPCSRSWGVSRSTPKGEVEGDLVQAQSQGRSWGRSVWGLAALGGLPALGGTCCRGVPALRGVWRPPPWQLLLWAVRILLECILVKFNCCLKVHNGHLA